jgi:hypothetical protein
MPMFDPIEATTNEWLAVAGFEPSGRQLGRLRRDPFDQINVAAVERVALTRRASVFRSDRTITGERACPRSVPARAAVRS